MFFRVKFSYKAILPRKSHYKYNALTRELKELDGAMSVFITKIVPLTIDYYCLDKLVEILLKDFATLLHEKGKGWFKNPENLEKTIRRTIANSYRLGDSSKCSSS